MTTAKQHYNPTPAHGLLKAVLLGVVILIAGAAIGASVMFMYLSQSRQPQDSVPEIMAENTLRRLSRDLNLTDAQRSKLDPILRQHYDALHDIRQSIRPEVVDRLEALNSDLLAVLTDEQQDIWEDQVRRLEDHFPSFRGQGRRMGPGRRQEHSPGTGPHGPREPLGQGYRRRAQSEPNEPAAPQPESPHESEY